MKYVLIIGDGMADFPISSLNGRTPLEVANKPTIDKLSAQGILGHARTVPEGFPPGSDTAIMSIFGCAPSKYYSGRAPLEAAAQGIALKAGDAAMRCNNISVSQGENFEDCTIVSHSAGAMPEGMGRELVEWLFAHPDFAPLAKKAGMSVNPAESYRHIAVVEGLDVAGLELAPPHDHLSERVGDHLTTGENGKVLVELMKAAHKLLKTHPLNLEREKNGQPPANAIWFWAEGTAAALPSFYGQYGKSGAVISAVPLCHGIAKLVGLDVIEVEGANGELDTNYEGKVQATLEALKTRDFAGLHFEAPDECTHCGDLPGKLQAIEWLDSRLIAPVIKALEDSGEDFRVLVLSDHYTISENGMHDGTPVPFILYDNRETKGSGLSYTEANSQKGEFIDDATRLVDMLFSK